MNERDVAQDAPRDGAVAQAAPTTEPQREILAAAALSPEANTAYNEAISLTLDRVGEVDTIERALATLVARHDALRTTFSGQLDVLHVAPEGAFALERRLHAAEPPGRREEIVRETWQRMMATPLPLTQGPLFRATWLQFGDRDAELILWAHHVVCDGWSFHVLLRELTALCAASPPPLPPAPSFAEFARRQRDQERAARDEAYWLARFADRPSTPDLPTDRARPAQRTFAARRIDHRFDAQTSKALSSAAGRLRATQVSVLLAAVAALLHRLTDANDITLGLPVARQGLDGVPDLVGHCVQTLPIRMAVEETLRFEELVDLAKSAVLDATEHFDFTFGALVRGTGLSGDASRVPLMPVLVNVDQPLASLRLGEATATIRTVPRTAEAFEVFLNILPAEAGLTIEATFNAALFTDETIEAWMAALERLLSAGAAAPATPVRFLPLAAASCEAYTVFNRTERRVEHTTWLAALAEVERRTPHATAVADSNRALTYAELGIKARALARELLRCGVRRGDVVGLATTRSCELLVALAGIHLAGAAHLPLDLGFPESRLQFMVADSGTRLVVTDAALPASLATAGIRPVRVSAALDARDDVELPTLEPHDLAYVIYTSGSTGRPKGVRVQHRALANVLASVAVRPGFTSADTLLAITTVSFDISLLELLLPLTVGGRVVVATREEAEHPRTLTGMVQQHGVSVMQATPTTWRLLVDYHGAALSALVALCGGERLPRDLAEALLPRVKSLWNVYGPTETTVWSTASQVVSCETASLVGTPFDNTHIYVLDRAGTLLPPGVPGEICIGGLGLAEGYHNLPQLTAERFIEHLELGRLYRTGDRGRLRPSGVLECLDRLDQQVKVQGFRIELGEIEAVLTAHAAVAEAAVAVATDGRSGSRLVAYVAYRDHVPAVAELKSHLRTALPEYMVPHQVVAVRALPRLPNGKLDRNGLARVRLLEPEEDPAALAEAETEMERLVTSEMCALLGRDRLGAEQDFFEVGGHSLLAARLVARLNRACDTQLSLRGVFEAPTPRRLARAIATGSGLVRTSERRIPRRTDPRVSPVTPAQERIWLMEQVNPGRPTYNLPSAHRLRGPFDAEAFSRAFKEVVRRQSALRTTFERRAGEVLQVVHDDTPIDLLPREDLSALPVEEREARLMARIETLTVEPFELSRLPLFAARLFRLGAEEHVLFFMPHHIVWDGWSFDVLYEELAALYPAFAAGQPSPLPELPITFGDYAAWHRKGLSSPEAGQGAQVWRDRLARLGSFPPLPVDRKREPGRAGHGATQPVVIDARRTAALHELAQGQGSTLFVASLAIYGVLLHAYSKESRLLLAMPIRGRESVDLESVMGCCFRMAPLVIEIGAEDTIPQVVRRLKPMVLDSLGFPDVSLDRTTLSEQPGGDVPGGETALARVPFQALFSFQDVRQRRLRWGSLEHARIRESPKGAPEELGLWLIETEGGLQGGLIHDVAVLTPATAVRLRDEYLRLVDAVLGTPEAPVAELIGARDWRPGAGGAPTTSPQPEPTTSVEPPLALHRTHGGAVDDLREPRGALEAQIATIWQRRLGIERVGRHDSFFDLGGNSLRAVRCVSECEAATGASVDLGAFFRTPTIAALAAQMSSKATTSPASLVALQSRGDGPPIYCLRGLDLYRHFATSLGTGQPVFGVYVAEERLLAGLDTTVEAEDVSIDRLASAYTEALTKAHPRGPLCLAGFSFGGVVALEVARRLAELGVDVQSVVLIDTLRPDGHRWSWWRWFKDSLARSRELGPAGVFRHARARLGKVVRRTPPAPEHVGASIDSAQRRREKTLRGGSARCLASLKRPAWPVLLLRAQDTTNWGRGYFLLPDYGWSQLLQDRLTVIPVEGDHVGMLMPPKVDRMIERLRPFLPT